MPSKILLISLGAMEVKIFGPTDHNGNENFIGHGKFWGTDIKMCTWKSYPQSHSTDVPNVAMI